MKTCDKCGHELFAAQGQKAKTVILNGDTPDEPTKLILRQYLTCRNSQCTKKGDIVLNTVDLQFDEE